MPFVERRNCRRRSSQGEGGTRRTRTPPRSRRQAVDRDATPRHAAVPAVLCILYPETCLTPQRQAKHDKLDDDLFFDGRR
ncbi:hypothetical protein U9M48_036507 [Paspalum notatum var. saurae]|uniref:Uncharacterized protein n=1 Tax=Paspalum notatum var. saurae TaxID=547442 RepID=A0AAQ3UDN9_PASNO